MKNHKHACAMQWFFIHGVSVLFLMLFYINVL